MYRYLLPILILHVEIQMYICISIYIYKLVHVICFLLQGILLQAAYVIFTSLALQSGEYLHRWWRLDHNAKVIA